MTVFGLGFGKSAHPRRKAPLAAASHGGSSHGGLPWQPLSRLPPTAASSVAAPGFFLGGPGLFAPSRPRFLPRTASNPGSIVPAPEASSEPRSTVPISVSAAPGHRRPTSCSRLGHGRPIPPPALGSATDVPSRLLLPAQPRTSRLLLPARPRTSHPASCSQLGHGRPASCSQLGHGRLCPASSSRQPAPDLLYLSRRCPIPVFPIRSSSTSPAFAPRMALGGRTTFSSAPGSQRPLSAPDQGSPVLPRWPRSPRLRPSGQSPPVSLMLLPPHSADRVSQLTPSRP